jgi:hypothetical protein
MLLVTFTAIAEATAFAEREQLVSFPPLRLSANLYLNHIFSGLWQHFMADGGYPVEAGNIDEPIKRGEICIG